MLSSDCIHHCRSLEIERIKTPIDGQPISDPKILEIGAGDGYMSKVLSEAGFNVTSIGPVPRKPLRYDVREMNAYELRFEDSSHDIIVSSNVLEHILVLSIIICNNGRWPEKNGERPYELHGVIFCRGIPPKV
jgi:2-polyprenyl-3-methyl-5-hydroxy-6-metoxy-1,4-benzoquinol methylase